MLSDSMLQVIRIKHGNNKCVGRPLTANCTAEYVSRLLRDVVELRAKLDAAMRAELWRGHKEMCDKICDAQGAEKTIPSVSSCVAAVFHPRDAVTRVTGRMIRECTSAVRETICEPAPCPRACATLYGVGEEGFTYKHIPCSKPPVGAPCVSEHPTFDCFERVIGHICGVTHERMSAFRRDYASIEYTRAQVTVAESIARVACSRCVIMNKECADDSIACMVVFHTEAVACLRALAADTNEVK